MEYRQLTPEELEYTLAGNINQAQSAPHIGYYQIIEIKLKPSIWNKDVIEAFSGRYNYKKKFADNFLELKLDLRLQPLFNRFSTGPTKLVSELIDRIIFIEYIELIEDPDYPGQKTYKANWSFST
jgi:hypothetical protein